MPLRKKTSNSYHHGDLATGLLDAVGELTAKFGLEAVSLRACAKSLGVSPAAAFRHYADKRALLTAFATRALGLLAQEMRAAQKEAKANGENEFLSIGLSYVRFALNNPGMFQAMWRRELLDENDEALQAASNQLGSYLASGFAGTIPDDDPNSLSAQELLAWSSVQGLANLLVDGPVARGQTAGEKLLLAQQMLEALSPSLAPSLSTSSP